MPEPTNTLCPIHYDEGPMDLSRVLHALCLWEPKVPSYVDVCDQDRTIDVTAHEVSHDED